MGTKAKLGQSVNNLFGGLEDNEDSNIDVSMYGSPVKGLAISQNQLNGEKYNKSETNECFLKKSNTDQQQYNDPDELDFIKRIKGNFIGEDIEQKFEQRRRFLSGFTPSLDKPILNEIKLSSKENKRKRIELDENDEGWGEGSKNPFLEITPQMKRAVRKWSFDKDANMKIEFSSPIINRQVLGERPIELRSISKMQKLTEDYSTDEKEEVYYMYEHVNDRGSKFDEDFIEIGVLGKGHYGSVLKWQNKLDNIEYAIKITNKLHPKKRQWMDETLKEVYALAALSASTENSYIVRYYRGWIENAQLYIQMELCDWSLYHQFIK